MKHRERHLAMVTLSSSRLDLSPSLGNMSASSKAALRRGTEAFNKQEYDAAVQHFSTVRHS